MRGVPSIDRRNLASVVTAVGVLLLLLAGTVMVIYNERSYREAKIQQVDAQARILASTVTAALVFDDRKAAKEYVAAPAGTRRRCPQLTGGREFRCPCPTTKPIPPTTSQPEVENFNANH
jgi:hypothetical protein